MSWVWPGQGQFSPDSRKGHSRGVGADPTWPNRARYSIPCAVMLGSGCGGGSTAWTHSRLGSAWCQSCLWERVCCSSLCHIFSLSVSLLLLFPLFCCSVKLPVSRPTTFLPVYFHSPPHRGRGRSGRVALLLPAAAETKQEFKVRIFLFLRASILFSNETSLSESPSVSCHSS